MTPRDALERLLVPLAALAMGRGLGLRDAVEAMKTAFLHAAERGLAPGERATDSRLALASGLTRRDVARLRREGPARRPPPAPARILADWPAEAAIPRTGPAPSFEALARAVRQDVHPRALLDTLVASGAVREEGDAVRLLRRAWLPEAGTPEQMAYLVDNLHDHAAAAVANVLRGAGHYDRAVHFEGLDPQAARELAARFADGQDRLLAEIAARAAAAPGGAARLRFGGYGITEDPE